MREYQFKAGISLHIGEWLDTDENLQALIRSKMRHVEISYAPHADTPAWTTALRETLETSPVNINSVHAPASQEVDISRLDEGGAEFAIAEIEKAISMAERLGAGIVVLHGSAEPIEPWERAQRIARSQQILSLLGERAQTARVRLALELLPRTCLGNTADELQELFVEIPVEQINFCLDTNHLANTHDLIPTVKQLGARIITLHISDYDGIDEKHWLPFEGVVDWGGFADALRGIEYSGAFIYETTPQADTVAEKLEIIDANFQRILEVARQEEE